MKTLTSISNDVGYCFNLFLRRAELKEKREYLSRIFIAVYREQLYRTAFDYHKFQSFKSLIKKHMDPNRPFEILKTFRYDWTNEFYKYPEESLKDYLSNANYSARKIKKINFFPNEEKLIKTLPTDIRLLQLLIYFLIEPDFSISCLRVRKIYKYYSNFSSESEQNKISKAASETLIKKRLTAKEKKSTYGNETETV